MGLALVSVLLVACFAWLIARSVTVPLHAAMQVAQRVAAGDLTARLDAQGRDETARLAQALATMTSNLARVVGSVRSGTDAIATCCRQSYRTGLALGAGRRPRHNTYCLGRP